MIQSALRQCSQLSVSAPFNQDLVFRVSAIYVLIEGGGYSPFGYSPFGYSPFQDFLGVEQLTFRL